MNKIAIVLFVLGAPCATSQGFMVVRLIADRVWQNLAVLHRATAFADAHRQVPSPH